jgi:hypothetical protein
MRLEIAVWLQIPSIVRFALVGLRKTAATLTLGDMLALGLRVRSTL